MKLSYTPLVIVLIQIQKQYYKDTAKTEKQNTQKYNYNHLTGYTEKDRIARNGLDMKQKNQEKAFNNVMSYYDGVVLWESNTYSCRGSLL